MRSLVAPPGRLHDLYAVINEGRALTADQLAQRLSCKGHQLGPLLFALIEDRAVIGIEHGTTRWYLPARLRSCVPAGARIIGG